jgi:hypothetical protein
MSMSGVINLMRVTHKVSDYCLHHWKQPQAAMNPLTSSTPNSGCREVYDNTAKFFGKLLHLGPELLSHFWKQQEDSVVMLASTQET